jgi:hypothetical protein
VWQADAAVRREADARGRGGPLSKQGWHSEFCKHPAPSHPPPRTNHEGQELEDCVGLGLGGVGALLRADHLLAHKLQAGRTGAGQRGRMPGAGRRLAGTGA